ncbi:MAG: hypothetical protein ABL903_12045 [Methylococcales bacterium]
MGKFKIIIICLALVVVVVTPDVVFESLHALLELILEFLHVLFEIVEVALDAVVEHLFDTGLHQTQIIVFYILLLIGFYGLLRLLRTSMRYCRRCHKRWLMAKSVYRVQVSDYWEGLAAFKKIQYVAISLMIITGLVFFLLM